MMALSVELRVRVIPNASGDEIVGWHAGALKVKTRTAPEEGKANKAICALIEKQLKLSRKSVAVLRGQTNPNKTLLIEGVGEAELSEQLSRTG